MPFVKISAEGSELEFAPSADPFPTPDVFQSGELSVTETYADLAERVYGETEERMELRIQELKAALEEEGLKVPGR